MFPANDDQFEEVKISSVEGDRKSGWHIHRADGWSFFIDKDSPIEPKPEMTVRIYGKGIGYPFRGVFLDGEKVFYRTEAAESLSRPTAATGGGVDIGPYKGPMVVDASLLHALWCYGNLSPVEGVVYSYGTHQKCLGDADKLLFDRAAAIASAATRTGE